MDELPVQRGSDEHDEDARSRRETYFVRQLGDEWEMVEPGIYRYVGDRAPPPSDVVEPVEELGDALAPGRHVAEHDPDEHPAMQRRRQRWWQKR
jgi:hypothetical protein